MISVKDRLPDDKQVVEAFCSNIRYTDVLFEGGKFKELYINNFGQSFYEEIDFDILYWKPIPENPGVLES